MPGPRPARASAESGTTHKTRNSRPVPTGPLDSIFKIRDFIKNNNDNNNNNNNNNNNDDDMTNKKQ